MAMVKVTISSNTSRKEVVVDNSKLVKEIFNENNIPLTNCTISLDGAPLSASEMNTSLADLGITTDAYLVAVPICQQHGKIQH